MVFIVKQTSSGLSKCVNCLLGPGAVHCFMFIYVCMLTHCGSYTSKWMLIVVIITICYVHTHHSNDKTWHDVFNSSTFCSRDWCNETSFIRCYYEVRVKFCLFLSGVVSWDWSLSVKHLSFTKNNKNNY